MKKLVEIPALLVVFVAVAWVTYPSETSLAMGSLFEFIAIIWQELVLPLLEFATAAATEQPWLILFAIASIVALRLLGFALVDFPVVIAWAFNRVLKFLSICFGLCIAAAEHIRGSTERRYH